MALNFRERSGDHYEETPVSVESGELHSGDLMTGASYSFAIALPSDALPNLESEHGELSWEIDARSNELGRDTHARRRIHVNRDA